MFVFFRHQKNIFSKMRHIFFIPVLSGPKKSFSISIYFQISFIFFHKFHGIYEKYEINMKQYENNMVVKKLFLKKKTFKKKQHIFINLIKETYFVISVFQIQKNHKKKIIFFILISYFSY